MKTRLKFFKYASILLAGLIYMFFAGCSKDDDNKELDTIPVVTTKAITNITQTSATGGGEITSDGNAAITVSGLVYSSTNATPTTSDSKTEETATGGTFTSELEDLVSGTTYHVRAYASNSEGTGYGETVTFSTGNAAPVVSDIIIDGTVQVGETMTVTYAYSDTEGDEEEGTTIQWYIADDEAGTNETAIDGATSGSYTAVAEDEFKYIRVGITPGAATGTTPGEESRSDFYGPVATEATTVTFTYNGEEVTYGIITSPVTGRKWLDRNLGAPDAPAAHNDWANYGDSFQWGRGDDGHQLMNRGASNAETSAVNGVTNTKSNSDSPGHGLFIVPQENPSDWRDPQNNDLWQGVDGINNPCPPGFRIPTLAEFDNENLGSLEEAYEQIKLTGSGHRLSFEGTLVASSWGMYWTSDIFDVDDPAWGFISRHLLIKPTSGVSSNSSDVRATGKSCRCIKDE